MPEQFATIDLHDILVGDPLPTAVYIYLDFRFITFRAEDDVIDRKTYDRLQFKKVKNLFVVERELPKFKKWAEKRELEQEKLPPLSPKNREFKKVRDDVHRKTLDIFQAAHPDKIVSQTLQSSKKLVGEVMKFPYASKSLGHLQTYSRGTVDHSVNVSILSVYLAMQMGYTHQLILQHVGMGGLLHDIGKTKVPIEDNDTPEVFDKKMAEHPMLGSKLLDGQSKVPKEVKMIIEQHHECHDGTGFPKKLRGSGGAGIYDLARIVSIANVFDEIVADAKGTLAERQRHAVQQLDQVLYRKFDPQKLDKAIKILKLGI